MNDAPAAFLPPPAADAPAGRPPVAAMAEGIGFGAFLSHSDSDCEALYAAGHGLYAQGRYPQASQVFALLVMCRSLESRYLRALAASLQMQGRYAQAIEHYATVMLIDPDDPRPLLHTCECLIRMGRAADAGGGLQLVIDEYDLGPWPDVKNKVSGLIALLRREGSFTQGRNPT